MKKDIKYIFAAIEKELKRARTVHPVWPKDKVHQVAIVSEEAGELLRAAVSDLPEEEMITEAIQTAAMCVRFIQNREGLAK